MTHHTGIAARHVNSYHHSNSLLFQFILLEFLEAYNEIRQLDAIRCGNDSPMRASESCCRQDPPHHLVSLALTKLVGSPKDYMRLFSWNFSEGLLAKLRSYCALFLQNADVNEKELIAIQHYTDKIWQACMQATDIVHETPQDRPILMLALDKASGAMQRLAKLIARLIHQFRDDENVIFYVLRHHEVFDKLYGHRFMHKLIHKIYPKGLNEVRVFLVKKYQERGFDNLLPVIDTTIKEIEASSSG